MVERTDFGPFLTGPKPRRADVDPFVIGHGEVVM